MAATASNAGYEGGWSVSGTAKGFESGWSTPSNGSTTKAGQSDSSAKEICARATFAQSKRRRSSSGKRLWASVALILQRRASAKAHTGSSQSRSSAERDSDANRCQLGGVTSPDTKLEAKVARLRRWTGSGGGMPLTEKFANVIVN